MVEPGETGWQVPTLSLGSLPRALEDALSVSAEHLAEMGRRSRAHVVARFAPRENHVLDQMVAIYDEVLAGPAAAS